MDILKLRKEINLIDKEILATLAKRFDLIKEIKAFKQRNNLGIEDKNREKEIIDALVNANKHKEITPDLIEKIWSAIFAESKRKQQ